MRITNVYISAPFNITYTFCIAFIGMKNTGYRPAGYNRKNSLLRHQISSSSMTGNSAQDKLMKALAKGINQSEAYSANRPQLKWRNFCSFHIIILISHLNVLTCCQCYAVFYPYQFNFRYQGTLMSRAWSSYATPSADSFYNQGMHNMLIVLWVVLPHVHALPSNAERFWKPWKVN